MEEFGRFLSRCFSLQAEIPEEVVPEPLTWNQYLARGVFGVPDRASSIPTVAVTAEEKLPEQPISEVTAVKEQSGAAMIENFQNLKPVFKSVGRHLQTAESYSAKIAFIMDVTADMGTYLHDTVELIAQLINYSEITFPGIQMQIAFVGYRDVDDQEQFVPTTGACFYIRDNIDDLCEIIMNTRADGGGDAPENVLGGMEKALTELDWSDCRVKMVFHIADAPHHGRKFSTYSDNHPYLEAKPRPSEDILYDYASKKIDYYFMKIGEYGKDPAAQMATIFESEYNQCQSRARNFTIFSIPWHCNDTFFLNVMEGVSKTVMGFLKRDMLAGGKKAFPRGLTSIEELNEAKSLNTILNDFQSYRISRGGLGMAGGGASRAGGGPVSTTSGAAAMALLMSKSKTVTMATVPEEWTGEDASGPTTPTKANETSSASSTSRESIVTKDTKSP